MKKFFNVVAVIALAGTAFISFQNGYWMEALGWFGVFSYCLKDLL